MNQSQIKVKELKCQILPKGTELVILIYCSDANDILKLQQLSTRKPKETGVDKYTRNNQKLLNSSNQSPIELSTNSSISSISPNCDDKNDVNDIKDMLYSQETEMYDINHPVKLEKRNEIEKVRRRITINDTDILIIYRRLKNKNTTRSTVSYTLK